MGINGDDYNVTLPYPEMYDWEYKLHGGIKSYDKLPKNSSDVITLRKQPPQIVTAVTYRYSPETREWVKRDSFARGDMILVEAYDVSDSDTVKITLPSSWTAVTAPLFMTDEIDSLLYYNPDLDISDMFTPVSQPVTTVDPDGNEYIWFIIDLVDVPDGSYGITVDIDDETFVRTVTVKGKRNKDNGGSYIAR